MGFGCHISIKKGYLGAAEEALKIGAEAFQYFPKNPRSLKVKAYDEEDARRCAAFCKKHSIVSIAHTPYPTNLSAEQTKLNDIIPSVLNDLDIAGACGSIGIVVHFGTYKGDDPLEGYKRMIASLNKILAEWDGDSLLLIENNAGKNGQLGLTIEELVKIRDLVERPEKIGFCLDTCHAFASGLWNGENWDQVVKKGEGLGYFDHLKAIHLNNSIYPSGSRKDRHANIHNGEISVEQMKTFITSKVVKHLPMILETRSNQTYTHKDEIDFLKKIVH
ncbi:endonuclease IV [Scopulibacillus darangshiensis]|uniref:Endonuclease IV n=1 Tax=Scopulibacillus darangshiensis TaxID=442528 RepID=A0A4R2PC66_9BACL|nr:deoxyribonuclease IV [Scopulibacillus darangshiensis]TCP31515.1 endonuclease IV [Scopulibacillus darangshiensis]